MRRGTKNVYLQKGVVEKNLTPGNSLWPFWNGEFTWPFQGVKTWPPTSGDEKGTAWITWEFDVDYLLNRCRPAKTTLFWSKGLLHQQFQRTVNFQLVFDFMGKPFAASVQLDPVQYCLTSHWERFIYLGCGTPLTISNGHQNDGLYIFGGILGFPTNPTVKLTERPAFQGNSLPTIRLLLQ